MTAAASTDAGSRQNNNKRATVKNFGHDHEAEFKMGPRNRLHLIWLMVLEAFGPRTLSCTVPIGPLICLVAGFLHPGKKTWPPDFIS